MKNVLMDMYDKLVLFKRGIIESVNNKLKMGCQIEHHRHRSVVNFFTNLLAGLVSYSMDPDKPTIGPLRLKEDVQNLVETSRGSDRFVTLLLYH